MYSSAIQQGHLENVADSALNSASYQQMAPNLSRLYRNEIPWSGIRGGFAQQKINAYYFSTQRPDMGQGTVIPVSYEQQGNGVDFNDGSKDPMQLAWQWGKQLAEDDYVRGDQAFAQMQGMTPVIKNRAVGNSITRELHHPLTGESSNMMAFSYMPAYATLKQQQIALHLANEVGAAINRRNLGNDVYWRNPNQSFRYLPF